VRDFSLTNADFAATDIAIEMLYLIEAKTAAMEASYSLNQRLQGAMMAAEEQALTDALTGLKNRRAMDHVLAQQIKNGARFALMQVDLDFFKTVNDTMGHAAGDYVLHRAAEIMAEETRGQDTVARVGGDEFTLILPSIPNEEVLARVAQRMIEKIEEPIPYEGQECKISASIGMIWVHPGDTRSADRLLSDADVALYASKRAGRAQHTFYKPELRENTMGATAKPTF
jgi:diguanylate cyclase (GGDEF)-like protein